MDHADVSAERRSRKRREPVVWFEVEDFLRYFDHFSNPTGLQRVPFEIFAEADKLHGRTSRVRFCRISVYTKQFKAIGFRDILAAPASSGRQGTVDDGVGPDSVREQTLSHPADADPPSAIFLRTAQDRRRRCR
jgi:hypothetical protein